MNMIEIPYHASEGIRKLCDKEMLEALIVVGMQRFATLKKPIGDGIFCCRMVVPEFAEDDRLILFMYQESDAELAPVTMMLWREVEASGMVPTLREMVNEDSYRAGPGAFAFRDLLVKSGVVPGEVRRKPE